MEPTVVITSRGVDRLRAGHPWIYRADVVDAQADGGVIVRVLGPRARPAGRAFFSDRSEIALRMLSRRDEPVTREVWRARLVRAIAYRAALGLEGHACRLVHGEADLLPSLIVDRYGDRLVVQALSQGAHRQLPVFVDLLVELVAPAGILARNDARVRALEGLPLEVGLLHGEVPSTLLVREGDLEVEVDPWKGQKTGLFLDQRENHAAAGRWARGRALDAFSYQGGFSLVLARRAASVLALDVSAEALGGLERNAARNGLTNVTTRAANVFDELRELERAGEPFETIVLDPPAFAKNKAAVPRALAGYKEINLRALKLLAPEGTLVTCSCSYNVDEATFVRVVSEAARDARVTLTLVERRAQARDHPILIGVPETAYLKCLVLRRLNV